jgi:hypothetical protein
MIITPTPDSTLITVPFSSTTNFLELADNCENFVEERVEFDDPALAKNGTWDRVSGGVIRIQKTRRKAGCKWLQ